MHRPGARRRAVGQGRAGRRAAAARQWLPSAALAAGPARAAPPAADGVEVGVAVGVAALDGGPGARQHAHAAHLRLAPRVDPLHVWSRGQWQCGAVSDRAGGAGQAAVVGAGAERRRALRPTRPGTRCGGCCSSGGGGPRCPPVMASHMLPGSTLVSFCQVPHTTWHQGPRSPPRAGSTRLNAPRRTGQRQQDTERAPPSSCDASCSHLGRGQAGGGLGGEVGKPAAGPKRIPLASVPQPESFMPANNTQHTLPAACQVRRLSAPTQALARAAATQPAHLGGRIRSCGTPASRCPASYSAQGQQSHSPSGMVSTP